MTNIYDRDHRHMHHALMLAARGLGRVAPNPAVGCVIVKDDIVLGRGWTQPGGRPHAETIALKAAGDAARGATAYVTLEPCAHIGETGSCAEALVDAGVERVVVACTDPDHRVDGQGIAILRAASIRVDIGVMEKEAYQLNRGFLFSRTDSRPFFSIKAATRIDGSMDMRTGEDRWITGEEARAFGHGLRASHDAIMVGIETVLSDDPMLDCRLKGLEDQSPIRLVMDSQARIPMSSKLVKSAKDIPLIIVSEIENNALKAAGVDVLEVKNCRDLQEVSTALSVRGITRVLVEGGPRLIKSFFDADLVDDLVWFCATGDQSLSNDAKAVLLSHMGLERENTFAHTLSRKLGADRLEIFTRNLEAG